MIFLRKASPFTVKLGPFLNSDNGYEAKTDLTLAPSDVRLSKNGGDFAAVHSTSNPTHDEAGYYDCPLDATDTGAEGKLRVAVHAAGALPVWLDCSVLPESVYDSLFSTERLQVDVREWMGAVPLELSSQQVQAVVPATQHVVVDSGTVDTLVNWEKTGYALSAAGVQSIWEALSSTLTTVGSIGKRLVDYVDVAISSRSVYAGGPVQSVTGSVGGNVVGNVNGDVIGKVCGNSMSSISGVGAWVLNEWGQPVAPQETALSNVTWTEPKAAFLDASIAAVDSVVDAIKSKTDYLPSATAGAAGGVFIAGSNAATSVNLTGNITGNLSGSVGSVVAKTGYALTSDYDAAKTAAQENVCTETRLAKLDAAVSSRLAIADYAPPDNAGIAAIQAKTDQLSFAGTDVKATLDGESVTASSVTGNVGGNVNGDVGGDVIGKVRGNSLSSITGPGVWAYTETGSAVAPQSTALSNEVWTEQKAGYLSGDSFTRLGAPATGSIAGDIAGVQSDSSTMLSRLGDFAGSGLNTVKGFFQALFRKDAGVSAANLPSNINEIENGTAGAYDPATDSLEAIRDTAPLGTAMRGTDGALLAANYTAPNNAGIDAIQAKTDVLSFTGTDVKATLDGESVTASSVTGNVEGNVAGSVNSVTSPVTVSVGTGEGQLSITSGVVSANVQKIYNSASAAGTLAYWMNTGATGQASAGSTTSVVKTNLTSTIADSYAGFTFVNFTKKQVAVVTGSTTAGDLTVQPALNAVPDAGDYVAVVPLPFASSHFAPAMDKTGFKLSSDGLDAVSTNGPTGVATNFRERLNQLWRRFFGKTTMTAEVLTTYRDNNTEAATTQSLSDANGTQTVEAAEGAAT